MICTPQSDPHTLTLHFPFKTAPLEFQCLFYCVVIIKNQYLSGSRHKHKEKVFYSLIYVFVVKKTDHVFL